jgi:hypothetical protein
MLSADVRRAEFIFGCAHIARLHKGRSRRWPGSWASRRIRRCVRGFDSGLSDIHLRFGIRSMRP